MLTPRSMPTAAWFSQAGSGNPTSTGTQTDQRSATRRTVVESALPEKRNSSLSFTHPITGKRTLLPSNLNVPGPLSRLAESRPSSLIFLHFFLLVVAFLISGAAVLASVSVSNPSTAENFLPID